MKSLRFATIGVCVLAASGAAASITEGESKNVGYDQNWALQALPFKPESIGIVDGDSFRVNRTLSRLSNIDAPERGWRGRCLSERLLALKAAEEAKALLDNAKEVIVTPTGKLDRYRRPLIRLTIDGSDLGEVLVARNVAVYWRGERQDWCKSITSAEK